MAVVLSPAPIPPKLSSPVEAPQPRSLGDGAAPAAPKDMSTPAKGQRIPRGKRERPCDACRKRKSKCVVTEGKKTCAACGAHGQECTYVEDPQPRKRPVDNDANHTDPTTKRRQVVRFRVAKTPARC